MAEDGEEEAETPHDPAAYVRAALDRLSPEGGLGVAVSGGGDSMALLMMAAEWARRRRRELRAVTVDHGLRPGSAAEAAFVGGQAARIGVPHQVLRAGPMAPGNLPAAAREARFALMAEWARRARLPAVALGHTMDDQAETLLMRLARGSGVEGLSGIPPRRDWAGVAWVRPVLGIRRAALREWLEARGVAWVEDPTNEDAAYDRVKARRALTALEPLGITVEGLAGTARVLARQRRVLACAAAELAAVALTRGEFGEARVALEPLRRAEIDTALRVFADMIVRTAGRGLRPRFRSLEPAFRALLTGRGGAATLGGCIIVPDLRGGTVLVCREPAAVAPAIPLHGAGVVWDGRWRITLPPDLPGGWRVGALGQAGCDHLSRAVREGGWQPEEAWSAAPRPVRETVPAIFPATEESVPPAAVPPAGWLAHGAPAGLSEIEARLVTGCGASP